MKPLILVFKIAIIYSILLSSNINAQTLERHQAITAYVYNFANNIQWQNEEAINEFQFLIIGEDKDVFNEMKTLYNTRTLRGKPVNIVSRPSVYNIDGVQLIYIAKDQENSLIELFDEIEGKNILLISDNFQDKRLVMINFIEGEEETLRFEINKANIINQKLTLKADLVLFGGTEIDVAALYREGQQSLRSLQKHADNLENDLVGLEHTISRITDEVQVQKDSLDKQRLKMLAQNESLNKQTLRIQQQQKTLSNQLQLLEEKKIDIRTQNQKIQEQQNILDDQYRESEIQKEDLNKGNKLLQDQKDEILSQTKILEEQTGTIDKQQNMLVLLVIITVLVIVLVLLIYYGYKNKQKLNKVLESKVEERTIELHNTNEKLLGELTTRKQAEKKILDALEMASNAEKAANLGSWSWNLNTSKVSWSDNMCRLHGIEPSEYKATFEQASSFQHPDDRDYVKHQIEHMLAEKKSTPFEYRIITTTGEHKWVEGTNQLLIDDKGDIKEIVGTIQDITEKKRAEILLLDEKKRLRTILDMVGNPIFVKDNDHQITLANKAFYTLFKMDEKDVIGYTLVEAVPEKERHHFLKVDREVLDTGKPDQREEELTIEGFTSTIITSKLRFTDEFDCNFLVCSILDITERIKSEQALKESEEQLLAITDNLPVLISQIDKDLKYTFVNQFYYDRSPFESGIIGKDVIDVMGEETFNRALPNMKKALSGESVSFENRTTHTKNNELIIFETNYIPHIIDGKIESFFVLGMIITERKLAEEKLKESEEKFKKIFKLSPALMTLTNIETGVYLDVNDTFLSEFGYTRDEVIGKKSTDLDLFLNPSAREDIIRIFKDQGFISNHEFQLRRKSGKILHSIFSSHIIELENKRVMLTTAIDISDRKLAEEALRESEAKLNALFTSLTEMVVMHELVLNNANEAIDYRIIDCNKVFTEFTGISKETAVGKLASEVYQSHPPPYLEEFAKVGQGGAPLEFTTFYQPFDKHFFISVVSPEAGKFATISTDISAMMQIQEMIMAKNKEMENYLYIASHDLRTPLVNIQGFSQRLKKQADSIKSLFTDKTLEPKILQQLNNITDEDIPKTLSFVLSSIEKMDALINGLLQLSRTGRVEMNIQKIDMNILFEKILRSLDYQIKEAQCKIHIDLLPDCYGDVDLLDQLFANIISNALKYSDSERALEISVNATEIQNRVIYTISDTGKGIAQKYLDKIWDIFYRIDPRSDRSGEGIGLSLVKRIADKHKGKVWVESLENKGSKFFIELNNRKFTEF